MFLFNLSQVFVQFDTFILWNSGYTARKKTQCSVQLNRNKVRQGIRPLTGKIMQSLFSYFQYYFNHYLMPLFHQRIKPRSCRRPLIVHSRLKKDKNGREYWVGTEVWD